MSTISTKRWPGVGQLVRLSTGGRLGELLGHRRLFILGMLSQAGTVDQAAATGDFEEQHQAERGLASRGGQAAGATTTWLLLAKMRDQLSTCGSSLLWRCDARVNASARAAGSTERYAGADPPSS